MGGGFGGMGGWTTRGAPTAPGVATGAPAMLTTGATTPAPAPVPSAASAAFQQLRADAQAIADKSQVTPALQATFRNDLTAISKDVTAAPSASASLAVRSDVASLKGTLPTTTALATLQADFTTAASSAGVTDATLIGKTFADASALIAASGVNATDVTTLRADLKAAGLGTTLPLPLRLGVDFEALAASLHLHTAPAAVPATPATPTTTAG